MSISIPRPAALVFVLLIAGCSAQRGKEPAALPLPPPAGRGVVYDTQVRFDLEAAALEVESRLSFVADEVTAGKAGLLLGQGFEIRGVRGPAARTWRVVPFEPVPDLRLVEVELDGVSPGATVTLEIGYAGKPAFPETGINGISPQWVELNLDSWWHPFPPALDRDMTGVLRLALPPDWKVAGSGAVAFEDGFHVIRNTVPQIDVAFVAAPSLERTLAGDYTVYHRNADAGTIAAVIEAAKACADDLDARYGGRDPLPRGTLVLAGRPGPAYARKNYVVLSEAKREAAELHRFLCHELAHYWTTSAGPFTPDHWMTEAFAEYVAARSVRERFGKAEFDRLVGQWSEVGRGPVWAPDSSQRATFAAMYRRAPYLFSLLEERIGTDRFDRFVAAYMTERLRTTPEMLARLRAIAGEEAERWFREELAKGPPAK